MQIVLIVIAGLVRWEPPPEPTPAPVPEMCLWRWEDTDGNFTYTIGPEDDEHEARPGHWDHDVWNGWQWRKCWEFEVAEKTPLRELWRRAREQTRNDE